MAARRCLHDEIGNGGQRSGLKFSGRGICQDEGHLILGDKTLHLSGGLISVHREGRRFITLDNKLEFYRAQPRDGCSQSEAGKQNGTRHVLQVRSTDDSV
ncbi:hypothetical protein Bbelb_112580 [Branchiostoma belcheri]|nr:hypothetical protein Bbelb_112580 [Branchiostoma belcheri]